MSRVRIPPSLPLFMPGGRKPQPITHGTVWGYQNPRVKCRCNACKAAYADYQAGYRDGIRAEGWCSRCHKWPPMKGLRNCKGCLIYYRARRWAKKRGLRIVKRVAHA